MIEPLAGSSPDPLDDPNLAEDLAALFGEESGLFHNLVLAAGLNPATDFRNRDLRTMNLAGADLRGFDFSGSDLRGTSLRSATQFDSTTQVSGAILDLSDRAWVGSTPISQGTQEALSPDETQASVTPLKEPRRLRGLFRGQIDETLRAEVGPLLMVGGTNGTTEIIDLRDNSVVRKFIGQDASIEALGTANGGLTAYSVAKDGRVCVWDVPTGALTSQSSADPGVKSGILDRYVYTGGRYLVATSSTGHVVRFDLINGQYTRYQVEELVTAIDAANSTNGDLLASDGGVLNIENGEIIKFPQSLKSSHRIFRNLQSTSSTSYLRFAEHGRLLLRCRFDSFVELWDVKNWRIIYQFAVVEPDACYRATCATVSRDRGFLLASSRRGTMMLANVKSGKLAWSVQAHRYEITDLQISDDGSNAISVATDKSVRVSSLASGIHIQSFRVEAPLLITDNGQFSVSLEAGDALRLRRTEKRYHLVLRGLCSYSIVRCAVLDSSFRTISREMKLSSPFTSFET